jgi:hypothetical protein
MTGNLSSPPDKIPGDVRPNPFGRGRTPKSLWEQSVQGPKQCPRSDSLALCLFWSRKWPWHMRSQSVQGQNTPKRVCRQIKWSVLHLEFISMSRSPSSMKQRRCRVLSLFWLPLSWQAPMPPSHNRSPPTHPTIGPTAKGFDRPHAIKMY